MQWQDQGVILACKRFGENALKLDVFTKEHGVSSGLVKGGASKKRKGQFDIGNITEVTWRGRLSEQLGQFTVEVTEQPASKCMNHALSLAALNSACVLLHQYLPEHHPEKPLYEKLQKLLSKLHTSPIELLCAYVWLEVDLLAASGFPLDVKKCAATGTTEGLYYLSPKSGRAVSRKSGEPYHDKLFVLPKFMLTPSAVAEHLDEIDQALKITSYFLEHVAENILHTPISDTRIRLLEQYQRHLKLQA